MCLDWPRSHLRAVLQQGRLQGPEYTRAALHVDLSACYTDVTSEPLVLGSGSTMVVTATAGSLLVVCTSRSVLGLHRTATLGL